MKELQANTKKTVRFLKPYILAFSVAIVLLVLLLIMTISEGYLQTNRANAMFKEYLKEMDFVSLHSEEDEKQLLYEYGRISAKLESIENIRSFSSYQVGTKKDWHYENLSSSILFLSSYIQYLADERQKMNEEQAETLQGLFENIAKYLDEPDKCKPYIQELEAYIGLCFNNL